MQYRHYTIAITTGLLAVKVQGSFSLIPFFIPEDVRGTYEISQSCLSAM
jgi:hypothetical protein